MPSAPSSFALAAVLLLGASCSYLRDRWNDTLDVLPLSVTVGPGLYAGANVTQFFGTGVGLVSGSTAGWFPTEGEDAKERKHLERFQAGRHLSMGLVLGDVHFAESGRMSEYGILYLFVPKPRKGEPAEFAFPDLAAADVTVRAHVALLGLRVTFSPGNLADWLLGWFGMDIAEDDLSRRFPDAGTSSRPHSSR